jgi:hypothetical protein
VGVGVGLLVAATNVSTFLTLSAALGAEATTVIFLVSTVVSTTLEA